MRVSSNRFFFSSLYFLYKYLCVCVSRVVLLYSCWSCYRRSLLQPHFEWVEWVLVRLLPIFHFSSSTRYGPIFSTLSFHFTQRMAILMHACLLHFGYEVRAYVTFGGQGGEGQKERLSRSHAHIYTCTIHTRLALNFFSFWTLGKHFNLYFPTISTCFCSVWMFVFFLRAWLVWVNFVNVVSHWIIII